MSCIAKRTKSMTQEQHVNLKDGLKERPKKSIETILSLNDNCLEEVFLYLSLNDLLHVFKAKSQFRIPSERAFKRKNRHIPLIVSNIHDNNRVAIQIIKNSVEMLQTFGHLITKLCIEFKLEKIEHLLNAVLAYCGENITELDFCHLGVHVKEPSILYDIGIKRIRPFLRKLNTQFPNLFSLKFDYHNISKDCPYSGDIIQVIPSLKTLLLDDYFHMQILLSLLV